MTGSADVAGVETKLKPKKPKILKVGNPNKTKVKKYTKLGEGISDNQIIAFRKDYGLVQTAQMLVNQAQQLVNYLENNDVVASDGTIKDLSKIDKFYDLVLGYTDEIDIQLFKDAVDDVYNKLVNIDNSMDDETLEESSNVYKNFLI